MMYFVVAVLFVLWLVVAAGAVAATRFIAPLRPLFPFVWRMCLWATIGFLVADAALVGLMVVTSGFDPTFVRGTIGDEILRFVVQLAILVGPLVASAIGWLAGLLLGILLAFLRQRRLDEAAAKAEAPLT